MSGHRHPEGQRARRRNPWPAGFLVATGLWLWLVWPASERGPFVAVAAAVLVAVCAYFAGWLQANGDRE